MLNNKNIEDSLRNLDISLSALNGMFFQNNMSAQLFFGEDEFEEKSHIIFHERFHYLQMIFTSYGHIKWGMNRTMTTEVINDWLKLYHTKNSGYISAHYYLKEFCNSFYAPLEDIWLNDQARIIANICDTNFIPSILKENYPDISNQMPRIPFNGSMIDVTSLYILESFAKFEEALFRYYAHDYPIEQTINPSILDPKYYCLIFYFIEKLGINRLLEFPVVCELALSIQHLPNNDSIQENHPGCRFLKIVDFLKCNSDLKLDSFTDDNAFLNYTNAILNGCEFGSWDDIWKNSIDYASASDLSHSTEMRKAIEYKINNPRALSYALFDKDILLSDQYIGFQPLFTITEDGVRSKLSDVFSKEVNFENNYQAFAYQILGIPSKRCIYTDRLQCGDSYFGVKECEYFKQGICDGHIDKESPLINLELSGTKLTKGCGFEFFLNVIGCTLKNISIIDTRKKIDYSDIMKAMQSMNQESL